MKLKVRFGSDHYPQEFVRPDEAEVQKALAAMPGGSEQERVWWCWDLVCRHVSYPFTARSVPSDLHVLEAFVVVDIPFLGPIYRITCSNHEFWQYPHETLAWGWGDCEDCAILLCALARNFVPADQVMVVVGTVHGWGHAWVNYRGLTLETTLLAGKPMPTLPDPQYRQEWAFNDKIGPAEGYLPDHSCEEDKLIWLESYWRTPTKRFAV